MRSACRAARCLSLVMITAALSASPMAAQNAPVTGDSVTIVPGPQFSTTSWIRWLATPLFGSRHRNLWQVPISLPVLDLQSTHGGLRPTGQGVGPEAGLLYLTAADGSEWAFWPLDRTDPRDSSNIVPGNISSGLIADLTSGRNPAGPLVAAELAEAADVPNEVGWLLALPEDATLTINDTSLAGRPGYLVRRDPVATSDSLGAVRSGDVIGSLSLLHRILNRPSEHVDAHTTLRMLLFNAFLNDLNPTFLEWRWEAHEVPGGFVWRPLGLFREGALASYNGLATSLARPLMPDLARFSGKYPGTLTGVPDQAAAFRFLVGSLGRPAWDSIAVALRWRMTDSVIAAAVARMPASYYSLIGPKTIQVLRERRDKLPEAVARMYAQVRRDAEVHATRGDDQIVAEWLTPDSLALTVGSGKQIFSSQETRRVTLFLSGGADTVRVQGTRGRAPDLRIAPAAASALQLVDSTRTDAVAIYAKDGDITVDPPGAVPVRTKTLPNALSALDSAGVERTDGNKAFNPTMVFSIGSGTGVLIGGGVVRTDWSGNSRPFRNRTKLVVAYGTESNSFAVELKTDFRWTHTPLELKVDAIASGVTAIFFYGFGNETPSVGSSSFYRAGRKIFGITPAVHYPLSDHVKVSSAVLLAQIQTPMDSGLFISVDQPYGTPTFSAAGLNAAVSFDTRDVRGAPRHGVHALVKGSWFPVVSDTGQPFGTVNAALASYVTPSWWQAMTVATRVSGTATFGDVPYFSAAFIGGGKTVRGLPQGRYNGKQSLFGNLDLRLRVTRIQFVMPWDFGVLGFADLGRVWETGEQSTVWHPSVGGGLWAALLDRTLAASLNAATGAGQGVFINAGAGFSF